MTRAMAQWEQGGGFSVDGSVRIEAADRARRERPLTGNFRDHPERRELAGSGPMVDDLIRQRTTLCRHTRLGKAVARSRLDSVCHCPQTPGVR